MIRKNGFCVIGTGSAASKRSVSWTDSVAEMVEDLRAGQGFRQGLRVKGVQKKRGVYEMTWAPDGRATFEIGKSLKEDEPHIIWRRIDGHDILDHP
jgi:hypothetical protein